MRVVMISKACIVGAYQRKLEELAQFPEMELTVLVPPNWQDTRGQQPLERVFTRGYDLRVTPLAFNGRFHLHYYPQLRAEIRALRPDLLHVDEEPYNLATHHAISLARQANIPACFFTWQNLQRRYPPPFRWWEQFSYRRATHAIAGNHAAAQVLRAKGYIGPISVIPQFGIDPELFRPLSAAAARPFTIGYAGGFVPEKGLDTLLTACATLSADWRLQLAGSGTHKPALQDLAQKLGIADRLRWQDKIPSAQMPAFYQAVDAFVLPSRTRLNWMEQFGRVLIEAMACAVPVVGSDSGEIPHVIAGAGLIFPEGDSQALAAHLQRLQNDPSQRQRLGQAGRQRVLANYTQAQVAEATYGVYQQMLNQPSRGSGG